MSNNKTDSNITAPTKFIPAGNERYAYRRFGAGSGLPLLCLQHFTGTMDNWDPAVTDPLAAGREVILFESAGIGRSSGSVPNTIAGMAAHAFAFLDSLSYSNVRRAWLFAWWHGRAADGARASVDLSPDDARRHGAAGG